MGLIFIVDFPLSLDNLTSNETYASDMMALYETNRTGPYASGTGDFLAFIPVQNFTEKVTSIAHAARRQNPRSYLPADTPMSVVHGYKKQLKLLAEGVDADDQAVLEIIFSGSTFVLGLAHPFSRGSVRLASTDPFDAPLADSGLLRNPLDVQLMVEAIKYARTVASTSAMQPYNPAEILPGSNVTTDADLEAFVRENTSTLFHPSGTCAAGRKNEGGVVDSRFRVYGVQNLRVVDASVFPMLPAAHIQSTVYAVAEMVGLLRYILTGRMLMLLGC